MAYLPMVELKKENGTTYETLWTSDYREIFKEISPNKITLYFEDSYIENLMSCIESLFSNIVVTHTYGMPIDLRKDSGGVSILVPGTFSVAPTFFEIGQYDGYNVARNYSVLYRLIKTNATDTTFSSKQDNWTSKGYNKSADYLKGKFEFFI